MITFWWIKYEIIFSMSLHNWISNMIFMNHQFTFKHPVNCMYIIQSLKFRILRRSFIGIEFALNLPPFANIDTNQKIVFYLQGKIFLAAIEIFHDWKMTKKDLTKNVWEKVDPPKNWNLDKAFLHFSRI